MTASLLAFVSYDVENELESESSEWTQAGKEWLCTMHRLYHIENQLLKRLQGMKQDICLWFECSNCASFPPKHLLKTTNQKRKTRSQETKKKREWHVLRSKDLIPILLFCFLNGEQRMCGCSYLQGFWSQYAGCRCGLNVEQTECMVWGIEKEWSS